MIVLGFLACLAFSHAFEVEMISNEYEVAGFYRNFASNCVNCRFINFGDERGWGIQATGEIKEGEPVVGVPFLPTSSFDKFAWSA
jgi:hypothetical protein